MGNTIWVDVEGRAAEDYPGDSSIMLRLERELKRLSKTLRVAPLDEFYDWSAMAGVFDDLADDGPDEPAGGVETADAPSPGTWFDPAAALPAVRALHDHLAAHPAALGFKPKPSTAHWPARLMEELAECQAKLADAAARGRRFRFLIVG